MKIRIQIIIAALALVIVANSTYAANILWTNTASGNWSDTNNWSPNQTPGSGDIAVITNDANYTVTFDADSTVGGIVLGAGDNGSTQTFLVAVHTLTLNGQALVNTGGLFNFTGGVIGGNAVINGALTCSGGDFSGALTMATNSVLNIGTAGMSLSSLFGGSALFTNYGTVNWSSGNVSCNLSPQVYNYGFWDAQADNTFVGQQAFGGSGQGVFNNFGTLRKSAGTTTTFNPDTIFHNSGTVDVESGTVTISDGTDSGTNNIAGGTTLSLGSIYLLSGNAFFSGAGTITGDLIGTNGVLSGTLNCSGVTLSGTLTLATNSTLNLGTTAVAFNGNVAGVCILTNYGTVTWNSNINGDDSPQIDNFGLWNEQGNNTFTGASSTGNSVFNNFGTLLKSTATGTTTLDASTIFNSSGTVDVESGTVSIAIGSGSGAITITNGDSLSLGASYSFHGNTIFSGTGTLAGFLIGTNAVLSGTLTCAGTTLSGTLTLTTNSTLNLGASTVTFDSYYAGSVVLTNYGTVVWGAGGINGNNFDGNSAHNPQIDNYGTWDAQADSTFVGDEHFGVSAFNNFGTFSKSAGTGTTKLDASTIFSSSGTVDVESGIVSVSGGSGHGTVNIAGGAAFSPDNTYSFNGSTIFSGAGNLAGFLIGTNAVLIGTINCSNTTLSGTLTIATNSTLNVIPPGLTINSLYASIGILTNYGTVTWNGGTITGDNNPQIFNYGLWSILSDTNFNGQQSSGTTTFNNIGIVRKATTTNTTSFGDFLNFKNTGTVDAQSGTVSFVINPTLAGGTLKVGISSSNSFGKISFPSGGVTLAGTITANLKNLFAPTTNSSFAVVTYGSHTGTFTSTNLPAGFVWQPVYGSTAFTLNIASVLPAQLSAVATQNGGTSFSFSFGAVPGQNYQIQTTTNLAPANWINLGGVIQATNSSITVSNTIQNPQLFYRAVLQ